MFIKFVILSILLFSISFSQRAQSIGYWNFDEGVGTLVKDATGNSNGIAHFGKWVDGYIGKAMLFDGKSTYVDCGVSKNLQITPDNGSSTFGPQECWYGMCSRGTISAWIKFSLNALNKSTFFYSIVQNGNAYRLLIFNYKIVRGKNDIEIHSGISIEGIDLRKDNRQVVLDTTITDVFQPDVWYNIVGTWGAMSGVSNETCLIAVNGVVLKKEILSGLRLITTTYPFRIGNQPACTEIDYSGVLGTRTFTESNFFDGVIDEVKVYNGTLLLGDIVDNYRQDVRKHEAYLKTNIIQSKFSNKLNNFHMAINLQRKDVNLLGKIINNKLTHNKVGEKFYE